MWRARKKKDAALESGHTAFLGPGNPDDMAVAIARAGEAERDARWAFVSNKGTPRGLWQAIDHHTGAVLAEVFGWRQAAVFLQRKALREPCGLPRFYTAHGGASRRHLAPDVHGPGKRHPQKIARQHVTLRTRIKRGVRKTLCFSQSTQMHDIVIGVFVHRYAFG